MLLRLIEDMDKALDNNCFFSALAVALMLPDICGKAEYPNEKSSKKRYIGWYDKNIGQYEKCPDDDGKMPYLSGEVVYSLRCCFLHQGTPNIEATGINEERCKIDNFALAVEKKKAFNQMSSVSALYDEYYKDEKIYKPYREYQVDVRRLCFIISACAKGYYKENKDKFKFFSFSIVDLDEQNKRFEELNRG